MSQSGSSLSDDDCTRLVCTATRRPLAKTRTPIWQRPEIIAHEEIAPGVSRAPLIAETWEWILPEAPDPRERVHELEAEVAILRETLETIVRDSPDQDGWSRAMAREGLNA